MHFVDTNIAVYAVIPGSKADAALAKLAGAIISVQVLNEFSNVGLRKLHYGPELLDTQVHAIMSLVAAVRPVDLDTHHVARAVVARYRLGFYDSLLIASALLAGCDTLYSEDMQDRMVIENRLTIRNPFVD